MATGRLPGLDALRGVAAGLVVACHLYWSSGLRFGPLDGIAASGAVGVVVFFALSGYLLYKPWLYGPVATGPYLARRFLRIYPAYVLALVGVGLVTGDPTFARDPARFLLLAQSYDQATFQTYIGPTWSLVLEAAFYMTLPLVGGVLGSRRPGVQIAVIGAAGLVSWFAGNALRPTPMHGGWILSLYPLMFWAFVPGMLIAVLERGGWLRPQMLAAGAVAFGIVGLGTVLPQDMGAWAIAGGCLIGLLLHVRRVPGSATAADLSYGVYLWHDPLIGVFGPVVGGLGTMAAATVSWTIAERPAIALGRRLSRRRLPPDAVHSDGEVAGVDVGPALHHDAGDPAVRVLDVGRVEEAGRGRA